MKRLIILVLICVNLALIMLLAFHSSAAPAYAQYRRGSGDYTMVSARRNETEDVMYVIDNKSNLMFGFWADTTRRETVLVPLGPRDLTRDFPTARR